MNRPFLKTQRDRKFRRTRIEKFFFAGVLFFPIVALAAAAVSAQPTVVTLQVGVTAMEVQKALNSLPASGGEVILPAGKITVTEPIVLSRDHQTLRGAGEATVLFLADGANCPVIIMGEPVNHPKRVSHLRVSDLFIDGNRAHQNRELWKFHGEGAEIRNNGITVQNISDSMVEHVTTARCRSGGLVTTLDTQKLTVRDLNSFDNEFDGLACFSTENCTFTNLYLHDNTAGAGISLDGNFHHNVIEDAVLTGNDLGIFMRWSHDNQFHHIAIHNSRDYGVFMAQNAAQNGGPSRTDCVDNYFTDISADQCGDAVFRVNDVTCTNNVVSGAKFKDNVHGALSLALPGLLLMK